MATTTKPSFEKALRDLEEIVAALESGDLPLEKALEKFEAGVTLSRYCADKLDEAEKRVTLLMTDPDGTVRETAFDSDEPDR